MGFMDTANDSGQAKQSYILPLKHQKTMIRFTTQILEVQNTHECGGDFSKYRLSRNSRTNERNWPTRIL